MTRLVLLAALVAGCGVKAPPRPPQPEKPATAAPAGPSAPTSPEAQPTPQR